MPSLMKNLGIAVVLSGVLWFGYIIFFDTDTDDLSVENAALASTIEREKNEFLKQQRILDQIDFTDTVFDDDRFNALVDYRQDLEPEPAGRENPFAKTE
jgi:hypothetical protein